MRKAFHVHNVLFWGGEAFLQEFKITNANLKRDKEIWRMKVVIAYIIIKLRFMHVQTHL